MFRNKYSNFLTILLTVAIVVIIVICTIVATKIYKNYRSEQEAKQAIAEFLTNTNTATGNNNVIYTNNTIEENNNIIINQIIPGENVTVDKDDTSSKENTSTPKKVKFYNEFVMIGYIEIPKTNIEYPILVDTTAEALETSVGVLYPTNPTLNEPGNVVIIGHNYRNGKFFSDNNKLSVGDKILIKDTTGRELSYTIYQKFQTTEQDTSFYTRDTNGVAEITLSTCTDDSKARTIVLAREG